jgi:cytochrome c oxidase subunit IV
LLLAFGLIASMANVLTKGSVLTDNLTMQRVLAWTQCIAIDASVAGTIIRTFRYHTEGEKVKTWLYGLLSASLLFTAAIVLNIESVQQTFNLTLDNAYVHVCVPVEVLIWIRSVAIVLLIVAHAMRHVSSQKVIQDVGAPASQSAPIAISPELVETLRVVLAQTTVAEEQPEQLQITGTATATGTDTAREERAEQPTHDTALFPDVPEEDRNRVIEAYKQGIPRRGICSYLRWGNAKYSTIVKPVLDAYEQQP